VDDAGRDGGRSTYEDAARSNALRVLVGRIRQRRASAHLTVHCAWCNRIKHGEAWVLEEARAAHLRWRPPADSTHGICPECLAKLTALPPE
jgi:hypothetical protein